MASCLTCDNDAGLLDKLLYGGRCSDCRRRDREIRNRARSDYEQLLDAIAGGSNLLGEASGARLAELQRAAALREDEDARLRSLTLARYAERVLEDDLLSEEDEERFLGVARVLGIDDLQAENTELISRLMVARINDGRLPEVAAPRLMARRGETVHLEVPASLLKEVVRREYQGGSRGMSFRVAKGVRYRVGSFRGRMVEIGRDLVVDDEGTLCVTSRRAVFLGARSTLDVPYSRLVGLELYSDGVRFNISNRKSAPLLRTGHAEVVAAMINAAGQRLQ